MNTNGKRSKALRIQRRRDWKRAGHSVRCAHARYEASALGGRPVCICAQDNRKKNRVRVI